MSHTTALLRRIDAVIPEADAEDRLLPRVNLATMLPAGGSVPLRSVLQFDGEWRGRCYRAVAGLGRSDSTAWKDDLASRAKNMSSYPRVVRRAPAVATTQGGAAGPVNGFSGPPRCGTTSTAFSLAGFRSADGHEFGRQTMAPYLRAPFPDAVTMARVALRMSNIPHRWTEEDAEQRAGAGRLPGGMLWGQRTCPSCGNSPGLTLDAWHRISECQDEALVEMRVKCFGRARRLVSEWAAEDEERAEEGAAFIAALLDAETDRDSRPGRAFVFLATLAAALPDNADNHATVAGRAGLPERWASMLVVPAGSARSQRGSVAMAALLWGFAFLVVTAAAGRKSEEPAAL